MLKYVKYNHKEAKQDMPGSPYHIWGQDTVDWTQLYEAEVFITRYVNLYGQCFIAIKEKYGTLRYDYIFPPTWILGRAGIGDKKLRGVYLFLRKYVNYPLYRLWRRWGEFILKRAVRKAIIKFPKVREEILDDFYDRY